MQYKHLLSHTSYVMQTPAPMPHLQCKHLLRKAPAAYANHCTKFPPKGHTSQIRPPNAKFRPNFQPKFPTQTHVDFSIEPQNIQSKQTDINTRNAMQFAKLFWSRISV